MSSVIEEYKRIKIPNRNKYTCPFVSCPSFNKYFSDKLKLLGHLNEFHPQLKNQTIMNSIAIVMREYKGLKIQYQQIINKEDIYEIFKSFKLGVYSIEFIENFINILHYFNCFIPKEINYKICSQGTFSCVPKPKSYQNRFYDLSGNNMINLRDTLVMYSTLFDFCHYLNKWNQKQYNLLKENITIVKGINYFENISKEISKFIVIQKIEANKENKKIIDSTIQILKNSESKDKSEISKINKNLINSIFSH